MEQNYKLFIWIMENNISYSFYMIKHKSVKKPANPFTINEHQAKVGMIS